MDLRVGVSAVVMNWLILLYFIILFAERVQSIVRSIRDKDVKLFGSGFDSYGKHPVINGTIHVHIHRK